MKIKNVRQYAYRGREFTGNEARLSLRPAQSPDNNRRGLHACVFLNDHPLGFLDNKSEKIAQEKGLWPRRSTGLDATLNSPPSNSATFALQPDTIIPPWQRQGRSPEPSVESIRAHLKTVYDGYANQVRKQHPALLPGGQFDTQVAQLALADGLSPKDVAAIVTTSPHLTQYRPNPERSSPEWKRYEQAAKNYIGNDKSG